MNAFPRVGAFIIAAALATLFAISIAQTYISSYPAASVTITSPISNEG